MTRKKRTDSFDRILNRTSDKTKKKVRGILDKIDKGEWLLFNDPESEFVPERMKGNYVILGKEVSFNYSKWFFKKAT